MQWPIIPIKNLTSLFPLIPKHICVYALGRIKWILGIIWPWNQHFNLKNQRNWKKQIWRLNFLIGIICILLHWWKKLTLVPKVINWQNPTAAFITRSNELETCYWSFVYSVNMIISCDVIPSSLMIKIIAGSKPAL